jgi:chromosome segregation ATPase
VEVARLREDLAQADENISLLQKTAQESNERERAAAEERQSDTASINRYIRELAAAGSDLQLTASELGRMRELVRHSQRQLAAARASSGVRPASGSSTGCRALVAEYIGALNEANRRLVNDGLFYSGVRKDFSR